MYKALRRLGPARAAARHPGRRFLVRTFVVFHDCTHGSLLPSGAPTPTLGAALGLLVLAPFARWRHDHAVHHASSGDLERRGVGDVLTLTVAEYRARSARGRLGYRMIRNPLVMFGLGPIFAMMIGPRIVPRARSGRGCATACWPPTWRWSWSSRLCWLIGWGDFLLVWAPAALLAGSTGIWLFYVQHQFEDAYWQSAEEWSYADAALRGSSYLKLPRCCSSSPGNIGLHHVHHLNARIPNYNLQRAHDENPMFHDVPTLSLWDGLRAVRLKLWDEDQRPDGDVRQARVWPARAPRGAVSGPRLSARTLSAPSTRARASRRTP